MQMIVLALVVAATATLAGFATNFDPFVPQPGLDALLLIPIACLAIVATVLRHPARPFPRPSSLDLAMLLATNAIVCALWLPHYDNWRWAYTGDSIAWYATGATAAERGLRLNLLSMRGVDFHFTYLHSLAFNALVFVFDPPFFWHRVGKMLVSTLSLSAIFLFVRVTVGRGWALAVAVCAAVNFHLIRMSYVSYGHIDSFIFYFNALTLTALIWRRQDDHLLWFLAGLNAGISLYFTQTAWSGVCFAGLGLIGLALYRRRFACLTMSAAAFAIFLVPIGLQWSDFLHLISSQTKPRFDWEYLSQMFEAVFALPYYSKFLHSRGLTGGFLRAPLDTLYLAGCALCAIAVIAPARRPLRLPRVAPALIALLLMEIVLMTITNNGYGNPSINRTYNLIPLQILIGFVPLITVGNWVRDRRPLQLIASLLIVGVLGAYAFRSIDVVVDPPDFLFGSKVNDGFIELRQRHPDRHSVYFAIVPQEIPDYDPGSFFDEVYGLAGSVTAVLGVTEERIRAACENGHLVCCHRARPCPEIDRIAADALAFEWLFREYPTVNSRELRCQECLPPT